MRLIAAPAVLAIAVLGGCSTFGVRTFGYAFPAEDGRAAVPVLLTDHAGAVTEIDQAPPGVQPIADAGFMAVPDMPNALVIHWIGGACDEKVDIDVKESGGLTFTLSTAVRPVACDAVAIPRAVLVKLTRPLDPSRTTLIQP